MYQKRNKISKSWPLPRKGSKYVVSALDNSSVPLLVIMRDILKMGETKKEVKEMLKTEKIKINEKVIKNERYPLKLLDIINIDGKYYVFTIKNKKYNVEETKKVEEKISKIISKKKLKKGKIQLNFSDGFNFISEKGTVGDSAVISLKDKKIKEFLELKKGASVLVIKGKHIGKTGKIKEIEEKTGIIELDNKIKVSKENLIVIK